MITVKTCTRTVPQKARLKINPHFSFRPCACIDMSWIMLPVDPLSLTVFSHPPIHPFHLSAFSASPKGPLPLTRDNNATSKMLSVVHVEVSFRLSQLVSISHTYVVCNDAFVMPVSAECCGQQCPTGLATGGRSLPVPAIPSQQQVGCTN